MLILITQAIDLSIEKHIATDLLPITNDTYSRYDFITYCLTLPNDRILNLINNPEVELVKNRSYYLTTYANIHDVNTPNQVFTNEGFLVYDILNYSRKHFGKEIDVYDEPDPILALSQYKGIIIKRLSVL